MTRRRLTERQTILVLIEQGATIPCYRCGAVLEFEDEIEREHLHALALGGLDALNNMAFSHKDCHKIETNGTKATTAGSTKAVVAKVKRIAKKRNEGRAPSSDDVTIPSEPPKARAGGSPNNSLTPYEKFIVSRPAIQSRPFRKPPGHVCKIPSRKRATP